MDLFRKLDSLEDVKSKVHNVMNSNGFNDFKVYVNSGVFGDEYNLSEMGGSIFIVLDMEIDDDLNDSICSCIGLNLKYYSVELICSEEFYQYECEECTMI